MTCGYRVASEWERPHRHPPSSQGAKNLLLFILVSPERLVPCAVEELGRGKDAAHVIGL